MPDDEKHGAPDRPDAPQQKDRPARASFRQADRYAGIGFQVAVALVFYVLAGNWLDGKLGTEPWLTLAGALLGFASMMYILVRFAAESGRKHRKPRDEGEAD